MALSRARDSLIVVGNSEMGKQSYGAPQTQGFKIWEDLVKYHTAKGTLRTVWKDGKWDDLLRKKLNISVTNPDYVKFPRKTD